MSLHKLVQLQEIDLSFNVLEFIPEQLFQNNSLIRSINLSYNLIKELSPSLLFFASNLQVIDLSHNHLSFISKKSSFPGSHKRKQLISFNQLRFLDENLFSNNHHLTVIKLNNNYLNKFEFKMISDPPEITIEELFKVIPLKKSEQVNSILKNYIEYKNVTNYNNLTIKSTRLTHIDVSHNNIKHISQDIYDSSILLEYFDASENQGLKELKSSHLFLFLKEFHVSKCEIFHIDESFFKKSNNSSHITTINFGWNQLTIIHVGTFSKLVYLKKLLLNNNKLTFINAKTFLNLNELRHLDLSYNHLKSFPLNILALKSLQILNLRGNKIEDFENPELVQFPLESALELLDLSRNCLTKKKLLKGKLTFDKFPNLKFVNLQYNALQVIPELPINRTNFTILLGYNAIKNVNLHRERDFKQNLHFIYNFQIDLCPNPIELICINTCIPASNIDKNFSNIKISCKKTYNVMSCPFVKKCSDKFYRKALFLEKSSPKLYTFKCPITKDCPSACTCFIKLIQQKTIVNCSHTGLTSLPTTVPGNTSILYFRNNLLKDLKSFFTYNWTNLKELYLENNKISSLDKWQPSDNLSKVFLNNNKLTRFNIRFNKNSSLEVKLGGNPWICDCSTLSFKSMLQSSNFDVKDILCQSSGKPIVNTPDIHLCHPLISSYSFIGLAMGACTLCIIFFICIMFIYNKKEMLMIYTFTHFPKVYSLIWTEENEEEHKQFDAFLCYCSSDRDVMLKLSEELEEKEPRFTLCIHERDWLAGYEILFNITNSVSNSRRIIIIVSEDFLQSIWFPVEFNQAYYQMLEDKVNRIILIIKDNLPPTEDLDRKLQMLLKRKTYLIWNERWFWEKLRHALPHKSI
ncbi:LOW QUALITY PROTEIN: protein toll-like [Centruroides vittatus]|uniref:LOW QUALITY PROTEIN: protein toll-like n=1 Tax=Centruroides vittatus TaxID=120091 RepID=UPI00350FC9E6